MRLFRIRRRSAAAVVAAAVCLGAAPADLAAADIKLATLVPDGSVWDKALKQMGAEWQRDTSGRVTLRIYPGGVAGDDPDLVRKMRIGQLHAAALTVTGLAEIDPGFQALATPLFFDSYEELDHVLKATEGLLAERLEAKGFVLLSWGYGGWVHLFAKQPIEGVADLKKLKLFVWAGNDELVQYWKRNGFRPVPLAGTDILTGLQTGLIEVLPTTPLAALTAQWFRQIPYMHDLGLAPLVGGTVITKRAWNGISEADRATVRAAARRVEERLRDEVPRQDGTAVEEMRKRGLTVTGGADAAAWRAEAERLSDSAIRDLAGGDLVERLRAARDAFRAAAESAD